MHPDLPYVDLVPRSLRAAQGSALAMAQQLKNVRGIGPRMEVHRWTECVGSRLLTLSSGSGADSGGARGTEDHQWTFRTLEMPATSLSGRGIVIGHPDSGYRQHPEYDARAVRHDIQWDFLNETDSEPMVTSAESLTAGSHGTGTGSTLISAHNPDGVYGMAPGASIAPLRVTQPGWLLPSPALLSSKRLSDAIHHAVDHRVDVLSISLGMLVNSARLKTAIDRALSAGIIVVAAAGNYTSFKDVYPAAYPGVVSCAACNIAKKPWEWSAWGDHVDVVAPGEAVWRATVDEAGNPVIGRSAGTSYATTHVAGLAALWLEKHGGREAIMRANSGDGTAVARTFLQQLRAASSDPGELPRRHYGAGLVNASRLLA